MYALGTPVLPITRINRPPKTRPEIGCRKYSPADAASVVGNIFHLLRWFFLLFPNAPGGAPSSSPSVSSGIAPDTLLEPALNKDSPMFSTLGSDITSAKQSSIM